MPARTGIALLACVGALHASVENPQRDGKQAVEWAHYLLRIEADTGTAERVLQGILREGNDPASKALAQSLAGDIAAARGHLPAAASHMRHALADSNLPKSERNRLLSRLMRIDPQAIGAITLLAPTLGKVTAVHPMRGGQSQEALLEITEAKTGRPTLYLQDRTGGLSALPFALETGQTVLDAAGRHLVLLDPETRRFELRSVQGETLLDETLSMRPEAARILNPRGDALAWLEGNRLRLWRKNAGIGEFLVEGPCTLHADPEVSQAALLLCGDQSLYRADFSASQVKPLGRLAEKPLALHLRNDYLLLQYADHIEVRRGPRFDAFSWGYPSQLQDRALLGQGVALLLNSHGRVQAFDLRTGQAAWQQEALAQDVLVLPEGLLLVTMAHTLEALDERGHGQWSYSMGWEGDPLLHLGDKRVTLYSSDGRRVAIDREVAKVAKRPGALLLDHILAQGDLAPSAKLAQLQHLLQLEPGNGDAWRHRYTLDKQMNAPAAQLAFDLVQAGRSPSIPAWSNHPVLRALAGQTGAAWIFKREYGPKFYPTLVSGRDLAFYLESDNQTLVILDPVHGTLVNSYRFAEELDYKASFWRNDTLGVASASRIYLVSPYHRSGLLAQYPLPSPICQVLSTPQGLAISDWQGNLRLMNPATGAFLWERKIGRGGLMVGRPLSGSSEGMDVTDLEGTYFHVHAPTGKIISQAEIKEGTPIEAQSLSQGTAIALAQGKVLCIGRQQAKVLWLRDLNEQIFSLAGNRSETLVLTTANKRVVCLRALDGGVLSDQHLAAYLFNRPLVLADAYWLGTTEPALEQRNFKGEKLRSHPLTDLPGSPTAFREHILLGTLDHFIAAFSASDGLR